MQPQKNLKPITQRFYLNLQKKLGKGCYGEVYEGYDKQKNRKIAIKHMNKPQNFQDQVQTLQKLSSLVHPNIMGFYGFEVKGDDVFLFVQFCPGGVLTDIIKKGLSQEEALDLFRQLVEGMCYMNAKGRMHRDLKPDNILIGYREDIKISDFGLAREYGLDVTGMMGTPLYAGPQVYTNFTENYNQNCDVWGAGLILHEMLTGKHPLEHVKNIKELKDEWKLYEKGQKRIKYSSDFHPQWEYITNIMLTHNFKKRPNFHDILEILKKVDDNGNMRRQIRNMKMGLKIELNTRQALVENYLQFANQKADVLTSLPDYLINEDYPYLKDSLKQLLVFFTTARYVSRMKKFARALKFKTAKFPNGEQVVERGSKDNNILLLLEKYRNSFESKYNKYHNQLKENIIPKLCQDSSEQHKQIMKGVQTSFKLVIQMKQGKMDVEESYAEEYSKLLNFHKIKPTDEKVKSMTIEHQQIYLRMLLCGFLDSEFPDNKFEETDYVLKKLKQMSLANAQNMVQTVHKLRKQLH